MSTERKLKLLRADLLGASSFSPAGVLASTSDVVQKVLFRDIQQTVRSISPELNLQYVDRKIDGLSFFMPTYVIIREFGVAIEATPGDIETWLTSAHKSSVSGKIRDNLSEVEKAFADETKAVRSKVGNFIRLLNKEADKL